MVRNWYSKFVGRMIKFGPKNAELEDRSQVAKTGKNFKRNYDDRQGLLPDTTWSAFGRYLRGVSTGDLKRPEKPGTILSLTWARVDHRGLSGWTYLDLFGKWLDTQPGGFRALGPGGFGAYLLWITKPI